MHGVLLAPLHIDIVSQPLLQLVHLLQEIEDVVGIQLVPELQWQVLLHLATLHFEVWEWDIRVQDEFLGQHLCISATKLIGQPIMITLQCVTIIIVCWTYAQGPLHRLIMACLVQNMDFRLLLNLMHHPLVLLIIFEPALEIVFLLCLPLMYISIMHVDLAFIFRFGHERPMLDLCIGGSDEHPHLNH